MSHILVVGEHEAGKPKKYTLELCGKASELATTLGGNVFVLLFGKEASAAAKILSSYGPSKVVVAEQEIFSSYTAEAMTKALADVIAQEKPQIVLASASSFGKDLFARTAIRVGAGLATDCVNLSIENKKLKARRPLFAGKVQADVLFTSDIQMATSRPNSYPMPKAKNGGAEIVSYQGNVGEVRTKIEEVKVAERGMVDLTEADRIVSGGRSLGSAENFNIIEDLAHVLHATVGASRAAVDAGYISHDHQVGQTGKTVNPSLYIACGISGAIQHLAGMRTSKIVVAINKDPEAPIFSKADYGIVGDLFEIIPALTEELKTLLHE